MASRQSRSMLKSCCMISLEIMAEEAGFEPADPVKDRRLSKTVQSTTLPLFHMPVTTIRRRSIVPAGFSGFDGPERRTSGAAALYLESIQTDETRGYAEPIPAHQSCP